MSGGFLAPLSWVCGDRGSPAGGTYHREKKQDRVRGAAQRCRLRHKDRGDHSLAVTLFDRPVNVLIGIALLTYSR